MVDEVQLTVRATNIAIKNRQTVGEKWNYYLTLQQLEEILLSLNKAPARER